MAPRCFLFNSNTHPNRPSIFPRSHLSTQTVNIASPSGSTPSASSAILVKTTIPASSSGLPFTSHIECYYYHAKGYIASHCLQYALVIDCEDDSLFEDIDGLLVMDPLEHDYDKDPSVMYEDDLP